MKNIENAAELKELEVNKSSRRSHPSFQLGAGSSHHNG